MRHRIAIGTGRRPFHGRSSPRVSRQSWTMGASNAGGRWAVGRSEGWAGRAGSFFSWHWPKV